MSIQHVGTRTFLSSPDSEKTDQQKREKSDLTALLEKVKSSAGFGIKEHLLIIDYRSKFTDPNFGYAIFLHCFKYHNPTCLDDLLEDELLAQNEANLGDVKNCLMDLEKFENDHKDSINLIAASEIVWDQNPKEAAAIHKLNQVFEGINDSSLVEGASHLDSYARAHIDSTISFPGESMGEKIDWALLSPLPEEREVEVDLDAAERILDASETPSSHKRKRESGS